MTHLHIKRLCIRAASFAELQENWERLADVDLIESQFLTRVFERQIGFALAECKLLGLVDAERTLLRIQGQLILGRLDYSALAREAHGALMAYTDGLNKLTFIAVPERLGTHVDQAAPFGESVAARFGRASLDITQAGNCIAVGAHTAAVFHLMRVTELGLRALCHDLGFHEVVEKYDRSGQGDHEYRPIEYATWEKILGQLQGKIDAKLAAISDRKQKHEAQEFYVVVAQEVWALKEAWRNHVMHSRREYIEEDAVAVMAHVKRLMVLLATQIREI